MSGWLLNIPIQATCSPEDAQMYAQWTKEGDWDLLPSERAWSDRQSLLEERGYILRQRYRTGWRPSWLGHNRDPFSCEDSIISRHDHVIDATRRKDNLLVSIKVVKDASNEVKIARLVSSPQVVRNPANHCVSVLDILPDPVFPDKALMVMPYLRPFNDPPFNAIGEAVEFVKQTLEGLHFMHSIRVAHRDCAAANIMMDGRPLYPQGHHPVEINRTPDFLHEAPHLSRLDHPVKYYFIDFGISSVFGERDPPYVLGTKGRDKDPPELSDHTPYNPFMLDIYILGHVYQEEFIDFLEPLVTAMMHIQPERRPTAEDAILMLHNIISSVDTTLLRWRLRSRSESAPERVVYDTVAVAREGMYHLRRLVR
ncbi:unnamed protein product [Somion occarium]|uniref:Protein kinase domain-containing protein n=2 Tax=Somion occarium TaxID=3059160 RepID=A0ABP1DXI2_9APHY